MKKKTSPYNARQAEQLAQLVSDTRDCLTKTDNRQSQTSANIVAMQNIVRVADASSFSGNVQHLNAQLRQLNQDLFSGHASDAAKAPRDLDTVADALVQLGVKIDSAPSGSSQRRA